MEKNWHYFQNNVDDDILFPIRSWFSNSLSQLQKRSRITKIRHEVAATFSSEFHLNHTLSKSEDSYPKPGSNFGPRDHQYSIKARDGPWPELTFGPQKIRGRPAFDPGTFQPNLKRSRREKIEKFDVLGEIFQIQTQTINGWPDLTQPDPGQKFPSLGKANQH